jgi:uncharacterized protein YdeI (YjbR/CyaY-like superfamily)
MPEPDPAKIKAFASAEKLNRWLKANHASDDELWIKVFKVKTGKPSVSWSEIVIEAVCWGWIDGVKKSIDGEAYFQRITP